VARRKTTDLRYTVDGSDKSYADVGSAISLSLTLACRAMSAGEERTFYVRDSITGDTKGYSEVVEDGSRFVVRIRGISRT
jgi:hypothetical protein